MIQNHFVDVNEMVKISKGAKRKLDSVKLPRYACSLVVQNVDPSKYVVDN